MRPPDAHGIPKHEFGIFKAFPNVVHAVFTRHGGVSQKPFDSLNTGFSTGDDPECVSANRSRILKTVGASFVPVFLHQVHGSDIAVVENSPGPVPVYRADGAVTKGPGKLLFVQVADCQSVLLYDPVQNVAANVHSGWRGSIKNIVGRCLDKMAEAFGTDPAAVAAGIGPSLGPCCAEFINYRTEIPEALWGYRRNGTFCFDFWELTCDQLREKGVKSGNIENMNICTKCFSKDFFSYRKEKQTGRFATVIGILETRTKAEGQRHL